MRSPGSIASAWRRRRSFMPTSLKPCSRVAAKFSGEPVRIHVVGAAAIARRFYAPGWEDPRRHDRVRDAGRRLRAGGGPRPDGHGGVLFNDAVERRAPLDARRVVVVRIVAAASAASSCTPTAATSWAVATSRTATGRCSRARPASAWLQRPLDHRRRRRPGRRPALPPDGRRAARPGRSVAHPARRGRRRAAPPRRQDPVAQRHRPVARGRRALRQRLRGGRGPRLRPRRPGPPRLRLYRPPVSRQPGRRRRRAASGSPSDP